MNNDPESPVKPPDVDKTVAQPEREVATADVFGAEPSVFNKLRDGSQRLRDEHELESVQLDLNSADGGIVYRLIERIGRGGMGVVYKAEQRSPIRRTVAVKVIKPGFDSAEVIARFESERQALARMDHANIARVLDADTDRRGRPYFVMEYVPGIPITTYADENRLSIKQRLEMMLQVCDAIAHAHVKAIIHRDITARNVLAFTTPDGPKVKVIDFGVAKALTSDRLTDHTFNTARGQAIGTYESMSPEQAEGSPDIDTRTDVYALGVLLYELLSGTKPFDRSSLAKAADEEIRRIIRQTEPQKPSTRLSDLDAKLVATIAADRQQQIESLTKQLRSELEWIPMKALRKERDRRYASPLQMAEDIQNYLEHKPLRAAPPSWLYEFQKTIRRNRGTLVSFAVVAFAIMVSVGNIAYFIAVRSDRDKILALLQTAKDEAEKARFAESRAEAEAAKARVAEANVRTQLASVIAVEGLFAEVLGTGTTSDKVFWNQIAKEGSVEPSIFATEVAQHYSEMGKFSVAEPFLRQAFETTFATKPDSREAVTTFEAYFTCLIYRNEFKQARGLLDRVGGLAWVNKIVGKTNPSAVRLARYTALLLEQEGRLDDAESLDLQTIADLKNDPKSKVHDRLFVEDFLAHFYANHAQIQKSIQMYRNLVAEATPIPEEQQGMLGMWNSLLGQALLKEGTPEDLADAEKFLMDAMRLSQPLMSSSSIERNNILIPIARLMDREHRYTQSAPYWQQALTTARSAEIKDAQRWHAFARYAESLRQQGLDSKADAVLNQEINDLMAKGADPALVAEVRHEWAEIWAADAKADAERAARLNSK